MKIFKISILLRFPGLMWEYKEKKGKRLWSDISAKLASLIAPIKLIENSTGDVLNDYYFVSAESIETYKNIADIASKDILEDRRSSVVVKVTEPTKEDISTLSNKIADKSENPDFWAAVNAIVKDEINKEDSSQSENDCEKDEFHKIYKSDKERNLNKVVECSFIKLSEQAKKSKKIKEDLLSVVKGQRHAVEEVVQTLFQTEVFSSYDEDRKGPLATFLFTGPSGVGKSLLAKQFEKITEIKPLIVDMSEYADAFAHCKFYGDHGHPAFVTEYVRRNPNGVLIFDEVEKAHINTIHLFLQILDSGTLKDYNTHKDVSFKNNIIIFTTNAGKSLYEDSTVCDLSSTPRSVILEALRTDINPTTRLPYFPECITTRMANGHVILFNHLEPYALMEIICAELEHQKQLFEKSTGIVVNYDPVVLSALVLYNGGGVSNARNLRSMARNIFVREVQEAIMQRYSSNPNKLDRLKTITINIDTETDEAIGGLFTNRAELCATVFAEGINKEMLAEGERHGVKFTFVHDSDSFKKRMRGVSDYVLIDPVCGMRESKRNPHDVEDIDSDGMEMFEYVRDFYPEMPVYILDTDPENESVYETLLARGARGFVRCFKDNDADFGSDIEALTTSTLINNTVYTLGRSGKHLIYNCAQYDQSDDNMVISFERLRLKNALSADDKKMTASESGNSNITFDDIVGCKMAVETLKKYCHQLDNPREVALSGQAMPKGVLLYGPPGTGKTMLAKAMANECNATFFPTTATSFFGSLVGQTEGNIRDLFAKARRYAPSVIFIDEVDALARVRGSSGVNVHNENALTCFLSEMDGFVCDPKRPVFVLVATNFGINGNDGRVLDPAFVRRFDNKILIPLPDFGARYELIKRYLKKHGVNFGENHESTLRNMAERTGGMSNADLIMMNSNFIKTLSDEAPEGSKYLEALDAYRMGEVNKMPAEALRQTACHEAGHALVCRLGGVTPSFLTIVSRGGYGGFMESAVEEHKVFTREELKHRICLALAGRIAEIEIYGEEMGINTGASSDLQIVRKVAEDMLKVYGMGDNICSNSTSDVESLIKELYERTSVMISLHRGTLERLADLLVKFKSLDKHQMEEFFLSENI